MTPATVLVDQRPIRLGRRIGKGGEGEVYGVEGDAAHAVKLYTVTDTADRERKIAAMIRSELAKHAPQVAFPLAAVQATNGRFAGFLMRLVADHKPLHELYSPGSRKHHFPHADYRFLVRTALNIARSVASVHQLGCVIGDINHSSILVSSAAMVALIDSDSFQVRENNQVFLCRVGVPEYTPPELQGLRLGTFARTANHDAFGLAVVIFQLLFMGRHPFIGTVRRGELPPLHEAIRDCRFVYSETRDVGMDQPPGTPALTDFPQRVVSAFETAFGSRPGLGRPAASAWVAVLSELETSLVQCTDETLHWYPRDASDCPWCLMDTELGTILFVPYVPPAETTIHPFDPGAGGFDLAAVWRQIESLPRIDRLQLVAAVPRGDVQPSDAVRATRRGKHYAAGLRIAAAVLATAILVAVPIAWFLWLPLYIYAAFGKSSLSAIDVEALKRQYLDADRRWQTALVAWHRKIGLDEFDALLESLGEAKKAYERLGAEERSQVNEYNRQRRARQLHAYLDGFEIRRAKIRGIGPAKEAALASYAIETAADVELAKVLAVPGFGQNNSSGLLEWRRKLETRFVYNERPNDMDQQEIARIRAGIQKKASTLRRTLLAGRRNLETHAHRVGAMAAIRDGDLDRLQGIREQLRVDIVFAGGTVPASAPPARVTAARPAAPAVTLPPAARGGPGHACPRCGSGMVLRTARRGRWAGQRFWGCSRYPVCKGTRNV